MRALIGFNDRRKLRTPPNRVAARNRTTAFSPGQIDCRMEVGLYMLSRSMVMIMMGGASVHEIWAASGAITVVVGWEGRCG